MQTKSISVRCPHCQTFYSFPLMFPAELACPFCSKPVGRVNTLESLFESCPVCQCRQFYTQKDFNRGVGCLIVLVGIVLVPFSYGLSLPVFAGVDWLIFRRTQAMAICYRCGAEFRGLPVPERFRAYMHHIGLKYDRNRVGS